MLVVENIQDFYTRFTCDDDCRKYLFNLKWQNGYACRKCGCTRSFKGRTSYHRRCAACRYDESCTSNTIFHKVKFPLIKAFAIAFEVAVPKKGVSTVDLAKELNLYQPIAWFFKSKIQRIMGSECAESGYQSQRGKKFSIDSIILTHRAKDLNGFQRVDVYMDEVSDEGGKRTLINTNWIKPSEEERAESQLVKGQFKEFRTNILLWNFKSWLTGTHHHCSLLYLKGYLDEFFFKLNFRNERETIWSRLIERSLTENRFVKRLRPGVLNI